MGCGKRHAWINVQHVAPTDRRELSADVSAGQYQGCAADHRIEGDVPLHLISGETGQGGGGHEYFPLQILSSTADESEHTRHRDIRRPEDTVVLLVLPCLVICYEELRTTPLRRVRVSRSKTKQAGLLVSVRSTSLRSSIRLMCHS